MLDILGGIDGWLGEGRAVALATVVDIWGSAPRRAGAKMGINAAMGMVGSVSGGCVETAVVEAGLESLKDGKARLLHYGVSDDSAWEVGLACGGKISVLVELLDAQWWAIARERVQQNCPMTTVTILAGDRAGQKMVTDGETVLYSTADDSAQASILRAVREHQQTGRVQVDDLDVLVDVYRPAPRLVMVGGAHASVALKNIAHVLGFRVVLIDPRQAFATAERFPDVELISHSYPDKVLPEIGLNADTYIAILTHDPKIDDPALWVALPSKVPYIGILSSKRTHEKRIERLMAAGVDPELLKRIRTPIGLEIGAQTPEEIALCIMAEIVAVRNGVLV